MQISRVNRFGHVRGRWLKLMKLMKLMMMMMMMPCARKLASG